MRSPHPSRISNISFTGLPGWISRRSDAEGISNESGWAAASHGFANRFLRESGRDVAALRPLLRHSRIDTTQLYTDEIEVDELAAALAAAFEARNAQASPDRRRSRQLLQLRCKTC